MTDDEKLQAANELDAHYARAAEFDARHAPTTRRYVINWDNGGEACGAFTHLGTFETEQDAQTVADDIETENRAQGVWGDDGFCEVIEIELPTDDDDDI